MCLYFKRKQKTKVAEEDIICYKVVEEYKYGFFRSFFMATCLSIGETYKVEKPKAFPTVNEISPKSRLGYKWKVTKNAFHSFVKLEDAVKELVTLSELNKLYANGNDVALVKCVIPKGSRYLVGDFDYSKKKNYVSDAIRYEEIITSERCKRG